MKAGLHDIIMASENWSPRDEANATSFEVTVHCKGPALQLVKVLEAGTDVHAFNENALDGGAGASFFLSAGGGVAGSEQLTVKAPVGRVLVAVDEGGAGRILVRTPSNETLFEHLPQSRRDFIDVSDGDGAYGVEVSWSRGAEGGRITGLMLGLQSFLTFDEAFALAQS